MIVSEKDEGNVANGRFMGILTESGDVPGRSRPRRMGRQRRGAEVSRRL